MLDEEQDVIRLQWGLGLSVMRFNVSTAENIDACIVRDAGEINLIFFYTSYN